MYISIKTSRSNFKIVLFRFYKFILIFHLSLSELILISLLFLDWNLLILSIKKLIFVVLYESSCI